MVRERTRAVCDGCMRRWPVTGSEQILTDNGKVFTGRFNHPRRGFFDAICREHGIEHLLTQPRSPTTTGKIERFHRSLRAEFSTAAPFPSLIAAQRAPDEGSTTTTPPDRISPLKMATPLSVSAPRPTCPPGLPPAPAGLTAVGQDWLSRTGDHQRGGGVSWQQVSIGRYYAGARCDVHVEGNLLRFWIGDSNRSTHQQWGEVKQMARPVAALNHHQECQGSTDTETSTISRLNRAPADVLEQR